MNLVRWEGAELEGYPRTNVLETVIDRKSPQTTSEHTRCADCDALRPAAQRPPSKNVDATLMLAQSQ